MEVNYGEGLRLGYVYVLEVGYVETFQVRTGCTNSLLVIGSMGPQKTKELYLECIEIKEDTDLRWNN